MRTSKTHQVYLGTGILAAAGFLGVLMTPASPEKESNREAPLLPALAAPDSQPQSRFGAAADQQRLGLEPNTHDEAYSAAAGYDAGEDRTQHGYPAPSEGVPERIRSQEPSGQKAWPRHAATGDANTRGWGFTPFHSPSESARGGAGALRDGNTFGRIEGESQQRRQLQARRTDGLQRQSFPSSSRPEESSQRRQGQQGVGTEEWATTSPAAWQQSASRLALRMPTTPELGHIEKLEFRGDQADEQLQQMKARPKVPTAEEKKKREQRELAKIKSQLGAPAPKKKLKDELYDPWAREYSDVVKQEQQRVERLAREALEARKAEERAKRQAQKATGNKR